AEDALVQYDFQRAEDKATEGQSALTNVTPGPQSIGLYTDLLVALGYAQFYERRPNDTKLAFTLAARLDPARKLDPARYEPALLELFQAAKSTGSGKVSLEVKGTGRIFVDGVELGVAPGTLDVTTGLHLVQLVGGDRETKGLSLNIPAPKSVEIADAPAN